METASRGQLILTLFMFAVIGVAYLVPREYASLAMLGLMIGLGAYVVGSSVYPRWAHGGKPFVLLAFRGADNSKHLVLARVLLDERGARVYECTKDVNNSKVRGYCFDVDYPSFVSLAEEKYPTIMVVKEGGKPEFEPDVIPTDFASVPVIMYFARGRLVGFVKQNREPTRWERVKMRFGFRPDLTVKIPVIRVFYDNIMERNSKAFVETSEGFRDKLGIVHIIDIEKEVMLTEIKKLRQMLKEMERVFYAPPSMAMRPLRIAEEGKSGLPSWVVYALIGAVAALVLYIVFVG